MGTVVRIELWIDNRKAGQAAIAAVMDEMRRVDRLMSTYKEDSKISLVNRRAATEPVTVSRELLELLARSLRMSELTDGAFDITYASAGHLYDFHRKVKPSADALAAALPAINYRHVVLDRANSSVRFLRSGVRIDLGGIAKGHAIDRASATLVKKTRSWPLFL
jgi:thiamine biosynthesis lipoprotein